MKKRTYCLLKVLFGGVSGIITSLVMILLMKISKFASAILYQNILHEVNFFAVMGEKLGISPHVMGYLFRFGVAIILGAVFALIFHRMLQGFFVGAGMGFLFGILWWIMTPFYMLPFFLLLSIKVPWYLISSYSVINLFIGHAVFGIILGVVYTGLKKLLNFSRDKRFM